jgi:L-iditol 2-dehydrogenase
MLQAKMTEAYIIKYEDVPVPKINDEQVLIKIKSFGVCGSDIQIYHGRHKYMTFPVVLGHEIAAEVVEIGKNVKGLEIGDKVTLQPQVVCGECYPCQIGRFNVCESLKVLGVHLDGCACEYFAADQWNVHKCPDHMSDDSIALVEPLAVGVGAVKRAGNYKDANVVVVGAGPIGNFTAQAAKALGAAKVMVTDINQKKLDYAKKCGIDYCINTQDKSLKDVITETFGIRKADIIIDCAATKGSFKSILEAARRSSTIVVSGNFKDPVEFEVPLIQRQEINMVGHMMYVKEDYSDAIKFLAENKINVEGFITQRFNIKDYDKAFKFIDENPLEVMKVLIEVE